MNKTQTKPLTIHQKQQGATLITVLLVLILIMIVGAISVRQSNTDLKLATSDQINTLLLQGADGANLKLERMLNGSTENQTYLDATANNGIFGHFFKGETSNDELIFCYNPRQEQALTNHAKIFRGTATLTGYSAGNCDPTQSSNYISGRNTVLTQVSLKLADQSTATEAFSSVAEGRDINIGNANEATPSKYKFDIRSMSMIPSYGNVAACLGNSMVKSPTVKECLNSQAVPKKQLYSLVDVEYTAGRLNCVKFGVSSGTYENSKCTIK